MYICVYVCMYTQMYICMYYIIIESAWSRSQLALLEPQAWSRIHLSRPRAVAICMDVYTYVHIDVCTYVYTLSLGRPGAVAICMDVYTYVHTDVCSYVYTLSLSRPGAVASCLGLEP